ncbi:MAG: entericidin A/B family lipoprotein [Rhodocyclaceae bacterium]|jgi:predicted small secreted protein|nr:entericidin A/B family lipoprotein [Rhodocyclaceae bacterium]
MSKLMIVFVVLFPTLCGCNTVRGIGQDLEKGGEAIQKASK